MKSFYFTFVLIVIFSYIYALTAAPSVKQHNECRKSRDCAPVCHETYNASWIRLHCIDKMCWCHIVESEAALLALM